MISRALKSFVKFNHPKTIMHPILTFTLDLLWEKLAMRLFVLDRVLTLVNFILFLLSGCYLNQLALGASDNVPLIILAVCRCLVYTMGFGRLLYMHTVDIYQSFAKNTFKKICGVDIPLYLCNGPDFISFILMTNMVPRVASRGLQNWVCRRDFPDFSAVLSGWSFQRLCRSFCFELHW